VNNLKEIRDFIFQRKILGQKILYLLKMSVDLRLMVVMVRALITYLTLTFSYWLNLFDHDTSLDDRPQISVYTAHNFLFFPSDGRTIQLLPSIISVRISQWAPPQVVQQSCFLRHVCKKIIIMQFYISVNGGRRGILNFHAFTSFSTSHYVYFKRNFWFIFVRCNVKVRFYDFRYNISCESFDAIS